MISILDLKSNDINKDFDLTLSFTKNSLTKKNLEVCACLGNIELLFY